MYLWTIYASGSALGGSLSSLFKCRYGSVRHSEISDNLLKRKIPRPCAEPMGFMIHTPQTLKLFDEHGVLPRQHEGQRHEIISFGLVDLAVLCNPRFILFKFLTNKSFRHNSLPLRKWFNRWCGSRCIVSKTS